jgi:hypothetical protein
MKTSSRCIFWENQCWFFMLLPGFCREERLSFFQYEHCFYTEWPLIAYRLVINAVCVLVCTGPRFPSHRHSVCSCQFTRPFDVVPQSFEGMGVWRNYDRNFLTGVFFLPLIIPYSVGNPIARGATCLAGYVGCRSLGTGLQSWLPAFSRGLAGWASSDVSYVISSQCKMADTTGFSERCAKFMSDIQAHSIL